MSMSKPSVWVWLLSLLTSNYEHVRALSVFGFFIYLQSFVSMSEPSVCLASLFINKHIWACQSPQCVWLLYLLTSIYEHVRALSVFGFFIYLQSFVSMSEPSVCLASLFINKHIWACQSPQCVWLLYLLTSIYEHVRALSVFGFFIY